MTVDRAKNLPLRGDVEIENLAFQAVEVGNYQEARLLLEPLNSLCKFTRQKQTYFHICLNQFGDH